MKIALLIYGSLDTLSGGYLYDRKLVQHLREQGDSVEIISLPWRSYPRHLIDNLHPALYRRLRDLDVDMLLQDELNHPSLFMINQRLRNRIDYPIISIVHHLRISEHEQENSLWQPLYKRIERRYLQSVDGFIFNSHTTRASVADLSINTANSIIAYPAADHLPNPAMHAAKSSIERLRLLFVGNIIQRKGLHLIINALAQLDSRQWTLDIVGDPTVDTRYTQTIRQQIVRADLDELITFHGRINDADLVAQYKQSDLLIVPSYEGFGIVYLEAMGFGLPVIASTAGAAHEIVTHGENGYLVDPDDVTTLTQQIQTLIADRTLLHKMSQAARHRYVQHPTWHDTTSQIREWLTSFCKNGPL